MKRQMLSEFSQSPVTLLILVTGNTGVTLVTPASITATQGYQNVSHVSKEGKFGYSVPQTPALLAYPSEEALSAVGNWQIQRLALLKYEEAGQLNSTSHQPPLPLWCPTSHRLSMRLAHGWLSFGSEWRGKMVPEPVLRSWAPKSTAFHSSSQGSFPEPRQEIMGLKVGWGTSCRLSLKQIPPNLPRILEALTPWITSTSALTP